MSKLGTNPTPKMNFYPEYVPATRPAAPVEGLETVAEAYINDDGECEEINYLHNGLPSADGFTELVTRENAEAIIAAKDARIAGLEAERDHWKEYSSGQGKLIESGAFVKNDEYIMITSLEADNKRLREALVMIARIELSFPSELREIARAALGEVKL